MTNTSLKIGEVVSRLRPRFKPENYGYNNALSQSKIFFAEKELIVCPPPLSATGNGLLPYFTCGTAARLAIKQCQQAGLEASEITIDLPIDNGTREKPATLGHVLCRSERTVIDLTTPFAAFLGLKEPTSSFPYPISTEGFLWNKISLEQKVSFNLFQESDLIPLAASLLNEQTLAIAHYGVQFLPENQRLVFYLDLKVLAREQKQLSAKQLWNAKVLVGVPVNNYPAALSRLFYHAAQPEPARSAIGDKGLVYYEEMEFPYKNEAYREPTLALFNKVWTAVTAFFAKVPEAN